MATSTVVRLAAPDYNYAFKHIPPIQFLLTFDGELDPDRLRVALDEVLADYWILRGNLEVTTEGDALVRVGPHRRGSIPVRVVEMDRPFDPASSSPGFAYIDEATRGPGGPLAAIRIGRAPGSTCLGVSIAHAIGDGRGLFDFVHAWGRAYAGDDWQRPSFDRDPLRVELVDPESPPTPDEVERATTYLTAGFEYPPVGEVVRDRLSFTGDEVAVLRSAAHAKGFTMNDVLTALAWRAFDAYAPRRRPDLHTLRCPVDYRRLLPDLDPAYFGTVLRDAVMEIGSDEFAAATQDDLAQIVHEGVRTIEAETVARLLRCYELLRRTGGPEAFAGLSAAGLIVTNFTRTKVMDVDFDGARPAHNLNLSISTRTANIVPQPDGLEVQLLHRIRPLYPPAGVRPE